MGKKSVLGVFEAVEAASKEAEAILAAERATRKVKKDPFPLDLPRAKALTPKQITEHADRVARQQMGEHVTSGRPKDTKNLAGRSMKESKRLQDLDYTLEPTRELRPTPVYEGKVGDVNIALPGDQTVSDSLLLDVNGLPIESTQQGGSLYGEGKLHLDDPLFWASGRDVAQQFQNKVGNLSDLYNTENIMAHHLAMGPVSNNYAMHFADANLKAIANSDISSSAAQQFNEIIRAGFVDAKGKHVPLPHFVGIENPEQAYLQMMEDPALRKWFNNRMKVPSITEPLGMPNALDVQWAITEPALRNMEVNLTGHSVGKMKPKVELTDTADHFTYEAGIPGESVGRAPELSPFEVSFPDASQYVRAVQRPQDFTGTIQKVFPHQVVDDQHLQQMSEYYRRLREIRGFAKGGNVGKAVGLLNELEKAYQEAKAIETVKELPAVSRIDMNYKDVTKRIPELTEAANLLDNGQLSASEYDKLVNSLKPVDAYSFVPSPATREDAMRALTKNKQPMYGMTSDIAAGEQTDLRLDIPAYKDHGVWVNSIHRKDAPTVYDSVSSVKNATMIGAPDKALKVAKGGPKAPFAVIRGEWNPVEQEYAVLKAQEYMNHPEWKQVGYDPERHGYFYDRATMEPIEGAEEVIQIGPLVLAKNPVYGKKAKQKYGGGGMVDTPPAEGGMNYRDYPNPYGLRAYPNKTGGYGGEMLPKAEGWLGELKGLGPKAGKTMTEYSISDERGDYPSIVPTLTMFEQRLVRKGILTPEIKRKAAEWRDSQEAQGQSAFKNPAGFAGGGSPKKDPVYNGPPPMSLPDLDTIKLTAQLLAKKAGQQLKKEWANPNGQMAVDMLGNIGADIVGFPSDIIHGIRGEPIKTPVKGFAPFNTNTIQQSKGIPMVGSENIRNQLKNANITSGVERPLTETALTFAGPAIASKAPKILKSMENLPVGLSVKDVGGQWLNSEASDTIKQTLRPISYTGATNPDKVAVNNWIDNTLGRYVQHRMGTPEDEIRMLADEGIYHTKREDLLKSFIPDSKIANRRIEAGYPEPLAKTPEGKTWETASDSFIVPMKAGELKALGPDWVMDARFPWLKNVKDEVPVHRILNESGTQSHVARNLGLHELSEALLTDLNAGKLKPENLNKVSVADAVQRSHANRIASEQDVIKLGEGMPTVKEYPDTGFQWKELTHENPAQLKKILKNEGDTMQNCIQGYCDDVLEEGTKLYSLRDAKGEPHVNIEVKPHRIVYSDIVKYLGREKADKLLESYKPSEIVAMHPEMRQYDIRQIKGKQNEAPISEYIPYVQDFVVNPPLGKQFNEISDFENAGLIDVNKLKQHGVFDLRGEDAHAIGQQVGRIFPPNKGQFGGMELSGEHGLRVDSYDLLKSITQDVKGNYIKPSDLLEHLKAIEAKPIEQGYSNYYKAIGGSITAKKVKHDKLPLNLKDEFKVFNYGA